MTSMIELLVIDMRALGIRSLALELSESPGSPPIALTDERPTLAPGDLPPETEAEPKDPSLCSYSGCGEKAGGILGGVGRHLCRMHAFQAAGVRTP